MTQIAKLFRNPADSEDVRDWPNCNDSEDRWPQIVQRLKTARSRESADLVLGELMAAIDTADLTDGRRASLLEWVRGLRRFP